MGGSALVTWLVLALAIGQAPSGAHLTVSVEHRVTTATAGDDVSLRCNIRTEGALRQVTWYKVLDAGATREKIFSYETFWPLNDTKSTPRQILSHQATVRLADVKLRDHGPYQCHVSVYDRSRMLEATGHVFLNVMVPPSSISLIAADAPAPFNRYEARNFTLVCIVSGGKPAPTVRFKRDGAIVEAQGDALAVPSSPSSLLTNPRGRPRTKEVNDEEEEEQEEMAMADAEKRDDGGGGDDGASWIDPDDTKPDPATSRPGETHAHSRGPGTRGATGSRPQADGDRAVAAAPPPLQPSHKSQGVVAASQAKTPKGSQPRLVVSLHEEPVYFLHQGEIPVSDGTVEVRARLTWLLSPTLDDLALFSCEVQHPALSMAMQLERTLTAPKGLRIDILPRRPLVGRTVRFSVDFQSEVFPEPLYRWTRVGGPLPDGRPHSEGPRLLLDNAGAALNGSMFRCSAENALGATDIHTRLIIYENPAAASGRQRLPAVATGGTTRTQNPLQRCLLMAAMTLALGT
ncbi:immunoglobulin superfamily member 21 isoform X1 [Lethenteron reissneri]|uniref:immunoglobulin superfamily member 21 isoform X1 n=1 Tax=Lethenteron reissneri TaxID=7753 RepID=UPI002AB5FA03|nr:immunoglobulin superfamily member 21 isoform X1 [Lethenteron reissneri]